MVPIRAERKSVFGNKLTAHSWTDLIVLTGHAHLDQKNDQTVLYSKAIYACAFKTARLRSLNCACVDRIIHTARFIMKLFMLNEHTLKNRPRGLPRCSQVTSFQNTYPAALPINMFREEKFCLSINFNCDAMVRRYWAKYLVEGKA